MVVNKSIVFAGIGTVLLFLFSAVPMARSEDKPTLYVREGCAHCAKVEAFLDEHSLTDTVVIRDIILDPKASEDYTAFMEEQNVPLSEQGAVPVLVYDGDKWISGDTPIIEYLADVNNIKLEDPQTEGSNIALMAAGGIIVLVVFGYGIVGRMHGSKKS
jgi:glutaredoxin